MKIKGADIKLAEIGRGHHGVQGYDASTEIAGCQHLLIVSDVLELVVSCRLRMVMSVQRVVDLFPRSVMNAQLVVGSQLRMMMIAQLVVVLFLRMVLNVRLVVDMCRRILTNA